MDVWVVIKTVVVAGMWAGGIVVAGLLLSPLLHWAIRTPAERRALAQFAEDFPGERGFSTTRLRRGGRLYVQVLFGSTRPPGRAFYEVDHGSAVLVADDQFLRPAFDR